MNHESGRISFGVGAEFYFATDGGVDERMQIVQMDDSDNRVVVVAQSVQGRTFRRFMYTDLVVSSKVRFITDDTPDSKTPDVKDPSAVVLSAIDEPARLKAFERAADVREVLSGYRSGTPESALPGEPRAQYRPELPKMARYQAKAEERNVCPSTVMAWVKSYREHGAAGLVSQREVRPGTGARSDPRFKDMVLQVMAEHVTESKPTRARVIIAAKVRCELRYGPGSVTMPCDTTAYEIVEQAEREVPLFKHTTKRNRDLADAPKKMYGKLRVSRPGEYILMDTTRSDVFAIDPYTMTQVNCEITVALDWFTRLPVGLRVTPISTKSIDAACVLYQVMKPPPANPSWKPEAIWPPTGVPRHVWVEKLALDPKSACATPALVPDGVVIDHASIFFGEHLMSVCQQIGSSVQPAHLRTGRDKGPIERFFGTLNTGLLQHLPGYKGSDVNARGLDPESEAWFYVDELEAEIRAWIAEIYNNTKHRSLRGQKLKHLLMTPAEKWAEGVTRCGYLELPGDPHMPLEFLPVQWRTVQKEGIQWEYRFYDHPVWERRRGEKSPYTHQGGKWPIHYNPDDIRQIYMRHPDTGAWITLPWTEADALTCPFSQDAMKFQRVLARAENRYLSGPMAIAKFLERRNMGLGRSRAERRIALRMAREQSTLIGDIEAAMTVDEYFDDDHDGTPTSTAGLPTAGADPDLLDDDGYEGSDDDFLEDDDPSDGDDFYANVLEVQ